MKVVVYNESANPPPRSWVLENVKGASGICVMMADKASLQSGRCFLQGTDCYRLFDDQANDELLDAGQSILASSGSYSKVLIYIHGP